MANQAKGQAGDFAFLASGKLCSTLQKQFSICVTFIWNKLWTFIANIEQLPMPSKLCWFQNQTCSCWPCNGQDFAVLLRHSFLWFQNSAVDEGCSSFHRKNVEPWIPKRSWLMTDDDVSFEWGHTSCSQVCSCKQFGDLFLNRWEVFIPHLLTKSPDSCPALFEFCWVVTDDVLFEWGHTSCSQVFSCNSVTFFWTDERCSFLFF